MPNTHDLQDKPAYKHKTRMNHIVFIELAPPGIAGVLQGAAHTSTLSVIFTMPPAPIAAVTSALITIAQHCYKT